MVLSLDRVSRAIVDVIRMNDYEVEITQDAEAYRAVATHPDGATHSADGPDLYLTVCALAEKAGIDLEDG